MKLIISLLLILSFQSDAELIYKNGFENTGLVSGTVTGLESSGLGVELTVNNKTEIISIELNGSFVFFTEVLVGQFWSVKIITLPNSPNKQSCSITNSSGTMPIGGTDKLIINCNNESWNWDEMNWDEGGWN